MVFDAVEDAQTGIGAVARDQDDLDAGVIRNAGIEPGCRISFSRLIWYSA